MKLSFENHEGAPNTIFVPRRMQGMVARPRAEKLTNNGIFPSALPGLQAIFFGGMRGRGGVASVIIEIEKRKEGAKPCIFLYQTIGK